jgi:hypothetical protein
VSVEVLAYRLEVRGVPAGRQLLRTKEEGRHARLEAEAEFSGPLSEARVVQLSRCHRDKMTSYEFVETSKDRGGERRMRIDFDGKEGLVRMRRGQDDVAETPYLQPFRDPLSMLREVRRAGREVERLRIPMLGTTVEAHALDEVELETALGTRRARVFQLHPGGSWVWVDLEPPHALLKLTQRLPEGHLDALLERVAQETQLPGWDAERQRSGKRRRGKRRKRRGRRRGGRSRARGGGGGSDG